MGLLASIHAMIFARSWKTSESFFCCLPYTQSYNHAEVELPDGVLFRCLPVVMHQSTQPLWYCCQTCLMNQLHDNLSLRVSALLSTWESDFQNGWCLRSRQRLFSTLDGSGPEEKRIEGYLFQTGVPIMGRVFLALIAYDFDRWLICVHTTRLADNILPLAVHGSPTFGPKGLEEVFRLSARGYSSVCHTGHHTNVNTSIPRPSCTISAYTYVVVLMGVVCWSRRALLTYIGSDGIDEGFKECSRRPD